MPLEIISRRALPGVSLPRIRRQLHLCLKHLKMPDAEVSVLLTGDAAVRRLNRVHRGQDKPTDILSFGMRERRDPQDPLPPDENVLGDLVVSTQTIARQARERGVSAEVELRFILIHGLLHLLGYDHAGALEEKRMQAAHAVLLAAAQSPRRD
ncbi:MAG: rRNA maturation RNase YbeY [Candidatus Firestonebacteria bacterium]|nr:rRNA maturation RNase YbeY [Candidatus Firestonebacteria bacterium]